MASTVFMDIVGYSKTPISQQTAMKNALNDVTSRAIEPVAESERIIVDTGDGAALCFFGDPEDALFAAMTVKEHVQKGAVSVPLLLRIGIHLGPVKIMMDVNGRPNVIGDGINFAERIMSFAGDGEILVSRAYYEVVSRLDEGNEALFHYLGVKRDKHVQEHQVYAVSPRMHGLADGGYGIDDDDMPVVIASGAASPTEVQDKPAQPAGPSEIDAIADDLFVAEEQRLAKYLGPLAGVIIKRASKSSHSVDEMYEKIAASIVDKADRADYLAGALLKGGGGDKLAPAAEATEAPAGPSASEARIPPSAEELARAESQLARHIGPLAGVLVRKASAHARNLDDLYLRLSEHIDNENDRRMFLATQGLEV
jgi:hypothetical protein